MPQLTLFPTAPPRRLKLLPPPVQPSKKPEPKPVAADVSQELRDWADRQVRSWAKRAQLPPSFALEDLYQVAHLEIAKRLPQYNGEHASGAPLEGYLYTYVLNACKMAVRRRNWTEATHEELPSGAVAETGAPDRELHASRQTKLVRWLIRERLTERQQFCLQHWQAGVDAGKIADRLKIPRKRVIEAIESAQERLRVDLREIGW